MREFILDTKRKVEFPIKVTFNGGAFSIHEDVDDYKIFRYVERENNMNIDDTYYFTRQQLRCMFYLLTGDE